MRELINIISDRTLLLVFFLFLVSAIYLGFEYIYKKIIVLNERRKKMVKEETRKGMGIAGFVLGLLSFVLSALSWIAMIMGMLGFIFSAIQMSRKNTGLAIAGFVLSILGFICGFLWLVFLIGYMGL
jgi:hypothetical protein